MSSHVGDRPFLRWRRRCARGENMIGRSADLRRRAARYFGFRFASFRVVTFFVPFFVGFLAALAWPFAAEAAGRLVGGTTFFVFSGLAGGILAAGGPAGARFAGAFAVAAVASALAGAPVGGFKVWRFGKRSLHLGSISNRILRAF
jgi:hypothetical protein